MLLQFSEEELLQENEQEEDNEEENEEENDRFWEGVYFIFPERSLNEFPGKHWKRNGNQ